MTSQYTLPRHKFLAAAISALGLAPMTWLRAQQTSPNDEIAIGVVGCGGQGVMGNFLNIPGVRVVAGGDVDANHMNQAKARVDGRYKNQDGKTYPHYNDLIQHPGLDAIIIGTPDHLHASAVKHIDGEKPFTWGLREGRLVQGCSNKFANAANWRSTFWLTGANRYSEPGQSFANSISAAQVAAAHLGADTRSAPPSNSTRPMRRLPAMVPACPLLGTNSENLSQAWTIPCPRFIAFSRSKTRRSPSVRQRWRINAANSMHSSPMPSACGTDSPPPITTNWKSISKASATSRRANCSPVFFDKLKATKEADGSSLFDHTCLACGSNLRSIHYMDNCPTLPAGGGAKLKIGQHLVLPEDTPLCNVWLTMLHGIGLDPNKLVRHGDSSCVVKELII